ncbi:hypothetical protein VP01_2225g1 [Puccinia sorghi]|uniref:Uncharacterized protein n=1 Tax=Puccinia sorghi TaxID=27349 RepID=A0A0L6VAK3_9BASI|nr:hypothetical protein VP01_2225g1 [Puccinia sorghi]
MALRYIPTRGDVKNMQSSSELCTACSRPIVQVTYQARSADEPARLTTFCSICPLDPRKLSPNGVRFRPDYGKGLPRLQRPRANTGACNVRVVASASRVVGTFFGARVGRPPVPGLTLSNVSVRRVDCCVRFASADLRTCCLVREGVKVEPIEVSRRSLCPNIFLAQVLLCEVPRQETSGPCYTIGVSDKCQHGGVTFGVRSRSADHYEFSMEVGTTLGPEVRAFVSMLYHYGLCPNTLDMCWGYGRTRTLLCSKPRAHDVGQVQESDHVITAKPDGQRCLIVRLGIVWGCFTSDVKAELIGWVVPSCIVEPTASGIVGAVLDAELMVGQLPVFIDLLQDDDGLQVSETRSIGNMLKRARELAGVHEVVQFRDYFSSLQQAERYCSDVGYPCDGMVAISKTGVEMKKLKPHKSVELRHTGGGVLVSNEGAVVVTTSEADKFDEGAIIEVRFQAEISRGASGSRVKLQCSDIFERSDKTKANSTEVCAQIIKLAAGLHSGPSMSTGLYSQVLGDPWSKTVLFIEKDESRAAQLVRSLRRLRVKVSRSPESLLTQLAALRNGNVDAVVCVYDANHLFELPRLNREIQRTVGSVVSNFSASHVLPSIEILMELKMNVVGCAYLYDGVAEGGSLVDNGDIAMKVVGPDLATVRWGSDAEYYEYPIRSADLSDYASVRRAISLIPLTAESTDSSVASECMSVCSKVFTFQRC